MAGQTGPRGAAAARVVVYWAAISRGRRQGVLPLASGVGGTVPGSYGPAPPEPGPVVPVRGGNSVGRRGQIAERPSRASFRVFFGQKDANGRAECPGRIRTSMDGGGWWRRRPSIPRAVAASSRRLGPFVAEATGFRGSAAPSPPTSGGFRVKRAPLLSGGS